MNPINLLEVTLYSKLLNEDLLNKIITNNFIELNKYIIIVIVILYFIIKQINITYYDFLYYKIIKFFTNKKSQIIISSHITYSYTNGSTKANKYISYSSYFRSLNFYLMKENKLKISSVREHYKIEITKFFQNDTEFILLPDNEEKIKICEKNNIILEITNTLLNDSDNVGNYHMQIKFILSIYEHNKLHILINFLKNCEEEYKIEKNKIKEQMTYEYINSITQENGKTVLRYNEFIFKSNKNLDKNIFIENKNELINYINRFIYINDNTNNYELEYERLGITYKSTILLYGEPGCGKSSIIKGILNKTNRHGVIIQWGRIKSCKNFCQIFRSNKINDKEYNLKDLCFIFEDFDANNSNVLKKRNKQKLFKKFKKNLNGEKTILTQPISNNNDKTVIVEKKEKEEEKKEEKKEEEEDDDEKKEEENKTEKEEALFKKMISIYEKDEDILTLECVLNVLDGIIELHNAMIVFTTNHIEQIDPAFMRSGRIDFKLELKKASKQIIIEMIEYKFNTKNTVNLYEELYNEIKEYSLSPADITVICNEYNNNEIEKCINKIVYLSKK